MCKYIYKCGVEFVRQWPELFWKVGVSFPFPFHASQAVSLLVAATHIWDKTSSSVFWLSCQSFTDALCSTDLLRILSLVTLTTGEEVKRLCLGLQSGCHTQDLSWGVEWGSPEVLRETRKQKGKALQAQESEATKACHGAIQEVTWPWRGRDLSYAWCWKTCHSQP